MIEVRLFAGLRQGRQKIYHMEPDSVKNVQDIMDVLDIQRREVNILLINGRRHRFSFPRGGRRLIHGRALCAEHSRPFRGRV